MDAGVSSLAFDSLSSVAMFQKVGQRTFHRLAWPTFFALTHQQCSLCKKPWKGAVSQIGAYIHKNCRLGTPFPQNQFYILRLCARQMIKESSRPIINSPDAFVNVAYLDKQRTACQEEKADKHLGEKTQGSCQSLVPCPCTAPNHLSQTKATRYHLSLCLPCVMFCTLHVCVCVSCCRQRF